MKDLSTCKVKTLVMQEADSNYIMKKNVMGKYLKKRNREREKERESERDFLKLRFNPGFLFKALVKT